MSDQKPRPGRADAGAVTREQHAEATDLISGRPRRRSASERRSSDLDLIRIEHEAETLRGDGLTPPSGPLLED